MSGSITAGAVRGGIRAADVDTLIISAKLNVDPRAWFAEAHAALPGQQEAKVELADRARASCPHRERGGRHSLAKAAKSSRH